MALDSFNRELARDKLAELLTAALVGTGKPAEVVYGYRAATFDNKSPVVILTSFGSRRSNKIAGAGAPWRTGCLFALIALVAYAAGGAWTEADAEDRLDLIDKTVADVIGDNRSCAVGGVTYWDLLSYANPGDFSEIAFPTIGGVQWKSETWFLLAERHLA